MITSFPPVPIFNLSGLAEFYFAPYQDIAQLPDVVSNRIVEEITFNTGKSLLKGYSTKVNGFFSETPDRDSNGPFYTWAVTGYLPGDSNDHADLMASMEECRHIVLTKDHSGIQRLVGCNAPLDFIAVYNTGAEPGSDPKGYSFTFSGTSRSRAPAYNV